MRGVACNIRFRDLAYVDYLVKLHTAKKSAAVRSMLPLCWGGPAVPAAAPVPAAPVNSDYLILTAGMLLAAAWCVPFSK